MPCSDGGYTHEQEQEMRRKAERQQREQARKTPLLCAACRALERLGYDFDENPELSEFWAKHKKEDEAREAAERRERERKAWEERTVSAALAKPIGQLTDEEKSLLKRLKYL